MKRTSGFTLIELIVTLAIAAILLAIAIPALGSLIRDASMTTTVNDFVTSINLARSEAVKRGRRVTMCESRPPYTECTKTKDWSQGWLIFEDTSNVGTRQDDEAIIHIHPGIATRITISGKPNIAHYISYSGKGIAQLPNRVYHAGSIEFCDGHDNAKSKTIKINFLGRPRTLDGAAGCPRKSS
ncbi:MAG: GspH/FimT family pseudopilin [Pseudomonadota bacterium]